MDGDVGTRNTTERSRLMLPSDFFWETSIAPMLMLGALRDAVLERSDKRMPKWKFRIADDIVSEIQPRPAKRAKRNYEGLPWFDCCAVISEEADGSMLQERRPNGWRMKYRLVIRCDEWRFKLDGIGNPQGLDHAKATVIRQRLINILPNTLGRLRPSLMLKPACLMCGKQLTDPVSMARWIGPECAATSSAIMPFTVSLTSGDGPNTDGGLLLHR